MKPIFKIILFICAFVLKANAQIYFNNSYDLTQYQGSTSVLEDNGYFILGQEITTTYRSIFCIKTNLNGDTICTKNYPRNQYAYYTGLSNSLINTYDNNYAFGGTITNLLDTTNDGDCLLVKLTISGDTVWTKNYGGVQLDVANIVIQSNDSGYVLLGSTSSYGNGLSDFYMIKTDSLGNFEWQKTFGSSNSEEAISGEKTLDGGYILTGKKLNIFYVVKTDILGNLEWEYSYPGTKGACYVKQLVDSSYVLVGASTIGGLGDQGCILKINKNGGFVWQKDYGGIVSDWLYSVPVILNDGSIVASGQTMVGGIPYGTLLKTDSLGNQQWLRSFYKNPSIDNYFNDVKYTFDNGFIICGQTYSVLTDSWLVKVDSNGCEIANCNVGMEEFQVQSSKFMVFPSPATSEINISIEGEGLSDYEISIVNILGEVQKIENNSNTISISHLASGIYFITAANKNGKKKLSHKFIKE